MKIFVIIEQKKITLTKKILFKLFITNDEFNFLNKENNGINRITYNRKDNNVINKSADITEYMNIKIKKIKISKISNKVKLKSNIFYIKSLKNYLKILSYRIITNMKKFLSFNQLILYSWFLDKFHIKVD